ncbi:MAG: hypothetical protein K2Y28_01275, partial [Burkholderiaceae bacterium]|nr:hypothetical protein [Burkholderiaceae bacterium]
MASQNFSKLSEHLARGAIDFSSASFKILLVTSALTEANLDSWVFRSAVTNEVANGNGYATGGVAIAATVSPVDIA